MTTAPAAAPVATVLPADAAATATSVPQLDNDPCKCHHIDQQFDKCDAHSVVFFHSSNLTPITIDGPHGLDIRQ